ncbi:hypothetical protein LQ944_05900 [Staphylococcus pasteuri]|uniref:hypothetical protein n=1 Tax=Staphylococcus pasteuri TaxID=45972 RepID=UPI000D337C7B|nr:hypothetical protein [Staphylococcus pasteuri]MCD9066717.1 hypothetical protein [Staphylococcus pasteuri]MCT1926859.1 hypothetical protein [Staphylococcus pasteuri]PTU83278.1 hypothetical protein BUZ62_12315 [Staphylococcus pasteuri]QQT10278.1 hypothetical protein I6J09_07015 [Staphylococcus pasteuri]RIO48767.1 hypothetical protein BUZ64_10420 [Staphylococcus pasteuri]
MKLLSIFFPIIIYVVILALQYFLSRTGSKLLGSIMPVLLVVGVIYGYQTDLINLGLITTISLTVMGLLFLLGEWQRAQKERKEKMK